MIFIDESSGFNHEPVSVLLPSNASFLELLPDQSHGSRVYKARINDKWLLIKRINPVYSEHPLYLAALEKEFDLGFRLDHPHIAKYLNKGEDASGLFLIAEYIDGSTLRSILNKNNHGLKDRKFIEKLIDQILDALSYLHKHQIFHLDLKPENIMITHKGQNVKIIDFGMSGCDHYISMSAGTIKYSSPEQLENPELADARSDFYSLGLIILEMFTGSVNFAGVKKLPDRYRKIVSRCIAPLQDKRFFSVEDIRNEFRRKPRISKALSAVLFASIAIVVLIILQFDFGKISNKPEGVKNQELAAIKDGFNNEERGIQTVAPEVNFFDRIMVRSKSELDSLQRLYYKMVNDPLLNSDSVRICELGSRLYSAFLLKVENLKFDNQKRAPKLILLDIKAECIDNYNDSLAFYLSKYETGSVPYIRLSDLYQKHANLCERKIDDYISRMN